MCRDDKKEHGKMKSKLAVDSIGQAIYCTKLITVAQAPNLSCTHTQA